MRMGSRVLAIMITVALCICTAGCSGSDDKARAMRDADRAMLTQGERGARDNRSECLMPMAEGVEVYENEYVFIDASNKSRGYLIVHYTGESQKVKLQLTGSNEITYTYGLAVDGGKNEVFPLSSGSGSYMVNVYENIQQNQYAAVFSTELKVELENELLPYLYPNQYVTFDEGSEAVALARDLAWSADDDLQVISSVYNYIIGHVTYDNKKAETVQSGYLPDIDETLETGTGICLDYAALMTAMLRSQRIPTRVEVGYAGTAYHAWISVFIEEVGWVNGMIEFDGHDWSLMDPTFASTTDADKLKDFIGDGENYNLKYVY